MCRINCLFNNISLEKCSRISFYFNISLLVLNVVIIFFTSLSIIEDKYEIILKTEMLYYVNNIFICFLMIVEILIIEYYRCKKYLIKSKINVSIFFLALSAFVSIMEFIETFDSITSIKRYMLLFNMNKKVLYNDYAKQFNEQIDQQKTYLTIISILLIVLTLLYIFYLISLFNIKIIYFSVNFNNRQIDERIVNESTEVDISNNDNIINYLNIDGIKKSYFFSQNIVNKLEKEYKDEFTQTIS